MNPHILKLRILLLQNKLYIILFVLASVFSLLYTNIINFKSLYNINETIFTLIITDYKVDGNKLSLEFVGKEKIIGNYYFDSLKEKNNFLNTYSLGDKVVLVGTIEKASENMIPNTFNYKKYLYYNKVYYLLTIKSFNKLKDNNNIFYKIKQFVYKRIESIENNKYIYTFVIGEKSFIESDVNNTYKSNGISHLFALSGLHVSLLSVIIISILKFIKVKELERYIITFILLLLFCFISGFSPSILRATLFFFLLGINKVYYLYIKNSNVLLIVYFILLLINPFIIYSLGFILSFTITYFILLFYENKEQKNYIKSLFLTSIISFFSSFGIIIYEFYEVNIMSIFFNMFFVPLVSFVIYPASLLTFIFPKLSTIFLFLTNIMEKASKFCGNINFGTIMFSKTSFLFLLIYYVTLYIIIKYKKVKLSLILICLSSIYYLKPYLDTKTYLYFLNVGQGDAIFIKTPYNKNNIVIDTGGKSNYKSEDWEKRVNTFSLSNTLTTFYKSVGAKKIDYMFITHGDNDHIGYGLEFYKYIKINNIFINKGQVNYNESKLNYKIIDEKEYIMDNINIYSLNDKIYDNENDNSMILLLVIENYKILLMGDASKEQEKYIIENYNLGPIDILKIGHHGSKTSTSEELIKDILPKYSVISVGLNNKFNHPSLETINVLKKYNSVIYRTDEVGNIIFVIDNNTLKNIK